MSALTGAVAPERGMAAPLSLPPPLGFRDEKSRLKITGVRMVRPKPAKPVPAYKPASGSWCTGGALVANPMSIYPKYKEKRSSFTANDQGLDAV